jgi:hypothetical protein
MLTVHVLPPTHELIAHREEAIAADASLIEEVMVIVDRGLVTYIHTPPKGIGYRFESDDSWIRDAIASAYASGVRSGENGLPDELEAPSGWTLWRDLKPGDIASSGGDFHGWVAISDDPTFLFANSDKNARYFGRVEPFGPGSDRFAFSPGQRRAWHFYRVVRRGLTGEQILTVLEAIEAAPADEPVQATIDRVLPEAR